MNVQEMIDRLMEIPDKEKTTVVSWDSLVQTLYETDSIEVQENEMFYNRHDQKVNGKILII